MAYKKTFQDDAVVNNTIEISGYVIAPDEEGNLLFDGTQVTAPSGVITDHGALDGLADDDHNQYATPPIWIPAPAFTIPETSGCQAGTYEGATNKVPLDYLAFDDTDAEYATVDLGTMANEFFNADGYDFAIWWTAPLTGDVRWELDYLSYSDGDPLDAAWTSGIIANEDSISTGYSVMQYKQSSGSISSSDGDLLKLRLGRQPVVADTLPGDSWLIGLQIAKKGTL